MSDLDQRWEDLNQRWTRDRVVPVVTLDDADRALPLGEVLTRAGAGTVEITLRTPGALAALGALAAADRDLVVGAGTVIDPEQVEAARRAGASFVVTPGLVPGVVEAAGAAGLPCIPGVATPTEALAALELGCRTLKFFPAAALGRSVLRSLAVALGHTGLLWVPTGGIDADNLAAWLGLPGVVACGGTWLAPRALVQEERWPEIEKRTRTALARGEESP